MCNVTVDGKLAFTQNFKYNGIAENSNGDMKYTVETSLAEVKHFPYTVVPERLTHFRYTQNPENVSIFPENFFVSIFEISRNLVKCVNLSGVFPVYAAYPR